ncbi:MAG TPA: hypothetical protein VFI23_07930 [Rhizomicrobium sp.]|nr:hypothetical protein [Rhizomicrobium sp.]
MKTAFGVALFCAAMGATPVFAAEAVPKTLAESDKLTVLDVVEKPGDTGPMATRLGQVIHVISGGTFERTFADGTKQTVQRKDGETALIKEKRPYSVRNAGTTTIHLIEIIPK